MNPIFINADKVADILYIISTSIVASGIFYLFTIYFPNRTKTMEMKSILHSMTKNLNNEVLRLFLNIFIYDTTPKTKYSEIRYFEQLNCEVIDSNKDQFVDYYKDPYNQKSFKQTIDILLTDFRNIQFHSSDYVSTSILYNIEYFKSLYNMYLINEYDKKDFYERYYFMYKLLYNIAVELNNNKL